ncbi:LysE family translocator [Paenibacillus sacheonensis]|uniref:LysE family transporter n=1 Tax=Paenibacillus sacheonensis TaxID=742054 RepID=A0A7X5BV15_9BACL|nr:LysE family transporter [Paenibacillus sacheonensis]NBC67953.1 LysE family transporter [Paenibacillus sacheonensis]
MMLAKGLLIGLSIAAPVGPIGILCMKRTLTQGRRFGFVSGLGAASADGMYGLIAAFGFGAVIARIAALQTAASILGGLFLCFLGYRSFRSAAGERSAEAGGSGSLAGAYGTTFLLTAANPVTILSFLGIFAGLDVMDASLPGLLALVLGVFAGSAAWWLFLSIAVGAIRRTLNAGAMRGINRLSGLLLLGFGIYSVFDVMLF